MRRTTDYIPLPMSMTIYDGKKTTGIAYTYDLDGNMISGIGKIGTKNIETYYDNCKYQSKRHGIKMKNWLIALCLLLFESLILGCFAERLTEYTIITGTIYDKANYFLDYRRLDQWKQFPEVIDVEYFNDIGISNVATENYRVRLKTALGAQVIGFKEKEPLIIIIYYSDLRIVIEIERTSDKVISILYNGERYTKNEEGYYINGIDLLELKSGIKEEQVIESISESEQNFELLLNRLCQEEEKKKVYAMVGYGIVAIAILILLIGHTIKVKNNSLINSNSDSD